MLVNRTLLGRYRITDFLGEGGFGETYLAVDMALPDHPQCVVKRLKKNPDPEGLKIAQRLFDGEANTLYKLGEHDQIPQLLAHFEEDSEFFLVQEFVKGHDLDEEITPGQPLDETSVIQLLIEILEVSKYVHNNNIIHRDIKPSNLMRRESDNKLVMIDFGAVKKLSVLSINKQGKTAPTIAVGTRVYMAPEQANGFPKRCSDIYAIGILAIQAITGLYPGEIRKDHTGEIIGWENFQISKQFANVLKKMVRYKYEKRYKNATEALQALVNISSKERRFPVKVIISLIFAAIAGIFLFAITRNPQPEIKNPESEIKNPEPDLTGDYNQLEKNNDKTENQLQTKAPSINVKVLSGGKNKGSGILISEENGIYTVLTDRQVIENGGSHQIETLDGKVHQAKTVAGINLGRDDMTFLQFNASEYYTVAFVGNLKTVFFCENNSTGIPTTYARRTSDGKKIPLIHWEKAWNDKYTPEKLCQIVSQKFQKAREKGILNYYIVGGVVNNSNVICITRQSGEACEMVLFTLRPEDDPIAVLLELSSTMRDQTISR